MLASWSGPLSQIVQQSTHFSPCEPLNLFEDKRIFSSATARMLVRIYVLLSLDSMGNLFLTKILHTWLEATVVLFVGYLLDTAGGLSSPENKSSDKCDADQS